MNQAADLQIKAIRANPSIGTVNEPVNIIPYLITPLSAKIGHYWEISITNSDGITIYSYPKIPRAATPGTLFELDDSGYTGIVDKKYELKYTGTLPASAGTASIIAVSK